MQLALLTSALYAAVGVAQPGEPWTGPIVVVYGTDIYDTAHQFRVPDNGPALPVFRLAMIKSAYIESPAGASCTITGRESVWELVEGTDLIIDPPEHFTSISCRSAEE
ncbi:uncharacterized protein DNG_03968 [Cephalotrichum gorgonifer]|uniref:Uncharacterized protein n=1 Tax=Cephalotrichum gorgonifer TaxID=2041049 RepID=A0AAE8MV85_9PEZI|nr:uncharacterized protein DNG_03968 [Cephalotrichum gorgonifer]